MTTKEQLETDNQALQYSLDDAIVEIKRLKNVIEILQITVTKMRKTIDDEGGEVRHLQYINNQLRERLHAMEAKTLFK